MPNFPYGLEMTNYLTDNALSLFLWAIEYTVKSYNKWDSRKVKHQLEIGELDDLAAELDGIYGVTNKSVIDLLAPKIQLAVQRGHHLKKVYALLRQRGLSIGYSWFCRRCRRFLATGTVPSAAVAPPQVAPAPPPVAVPSPAPPAPEDKPIPGAYSYDYQNTGAYKMTPIDADYLKDKW